MSAQNIIGSYLYKIGWQVDKLPDIEKSLQTIKFIQLGSVLVDVAKAFYSIGKAMAQFSDNVIKADIQTQIFARRLLTTVQNARSLQSVMGAMGINSLSELRDVALNPTLRAQFMALRKFTQGLEPGDSVQGGLGNFRQVSFQLQKINILLTYFSQYVVGILGQILEGPLTDLTEFLDAFTREFKAQIIPWATQIATFMAYIWRMIQVGADIVMRGFKLMGDWHLGSWLRIIGDLILAVLYLVRDAVKWVQDRWPKAPQNALKGGLIGGLAGAGVALAAAPFTGGASLAALPEATAIGAGAGSGIGIAMEAIKHFQGGGKGRLISKNNSGAIKEIVAAANAVAPDAETAKLIVAQALLESGYGRSSLAKKYNNYFGIKGRGSAGSISLPTNEFYGGRMHRVNANFRAYKTAGDSFRDHLKLLSTGRYKGVMAAKTFEEKALAVKAAGYATDPNYSSSLVNTLRQSGVTININGYNRDPGELAQYVKTTLTTRILQPATP